MLLLIDTRTNQNGTDNWTLYPAGATFIHIDIDPMEIRRTCDALAALTSALRERGQTTIMINIPASPFIHAMTAALAVALSPTALGPGCCWG